MSKIRTMYSFSELSRMRKEVESGSRLTKRDILGLINMAGTCVTNSMKAKQKLQLISSIVEE